MPIRTTKLLLMLPVLFTISSCANFEWYRGYGDTADAARTYERFLPRAEAGDPEMQNLLGYMLAYGEESDRDLERAHSWFHKAAATGHKLARRNDAYMHSFFNTGAPGVPSNLATDHGRGVTQQQGLSIDIKAADENAILTPDPRVTSGGNSYAAFCAGCHGFNGIAAYVNAPSFAMNERLEKSDSTLFRNVSNGMNECPGWGGILPDEELLDTIAFIRTLRVSFEMGIAKSPRQAPQRHFLFGAMSQDSYFYRVN